MKETSSKYLIYVAGQRLFIGWDAETAKRFAWRVNKHGKPPRSAELLDPARSSYAVVHYLWLLLPAPAFKKYNTAEDLFAAIDMETEAGKIGWAVAKVLADLTQTI